MNLLITPQAKKVILAIAGLGLISGLSLTAYKLIPRVARSPIIKITIPEGSSRVEAAKIIASQLPTFDSKYFLTKTFNLEGELFPDTYFVGSSTKEDTIISLMHDNFEAKWQPLMPAIATSTHSQSQVLIMASIVEKEAKTEEDKRLVAGILWKRLADGMLLQVDAPLLYSSSTAYDTYKQLGLTPGPITNPGLESIMAALYPESSPFWFYLSDKRGSMHYARTFDEHKLNKIKYLNK